MNSIPPFLQLKDRLIWLYVKVQPRAGKNEIGEVLGRELKIKIAAPPVDSAANEALIRFLAETLECPRSAVELLRGRTSRHKVIAIKGLPVQTLLARLIP